MRDEGRHRALARPRGARERGAAQPPVPRRGSRSSPTAHPPPRPRRRPSAASCGRIVKSLLFDCDGRGCSSSSPATAAPTPPRWRGRPRCEPGPRRGRRAGPRRHGLRRGGGRSGRARPRRRVLLDRRIPAEGTLWVGAGSPRHMAGLAGVRARPGHAGGVGRRRRGHVKSEKEEADAGDREDLDERRAGGLGGRPGPRRLRTACTTAPESSRASAAMRPSAVPPSSGSCDHLDRLDASARCSTWSCRTRSRSCVRLLRDARRQRPRGVVPPADRVLRLRRARRPQRARTRWTSRSCASPGAPTSARTSQQHGIRAMISSWRRVGPNTIPHAAKATGVYLNSMLATHEARRGRLRRGDHAHRGRLHRRRPGRDDLRRQGRHRLHARTCQLVDPARDHPRLDHPDRPGHRLHRSSRSR